MIKLLADLFKRSAMDSLGPSLGVGGVIESFQGAITEKHDSRIIHSSSIDAIASTLQFCFGFRHLGGLCNPNTA